MSTLLRLFENPTFRRSVLGLLVAVMFVNWYYYESSYAYLQEWIGYVVGLAFGARGIEIGKLLGYVCLLLGNASLSLCIVHLFFYDKAITKEAFGYLALYFCITFGGVCLTYVLGNAELYGYARAAADLLASPLVECTLIPVMKLRLIERQRLG